MAKMILNENKFLNDLLENRSEENLKNVGLSKTQLVFLLSKKYKDYDKVREVFESFNFSDYYVTKWNDTFIKSCDIVNKYDIDLKDYGYIPLYKSELENIKELKKDKFKKLLFTIYILSRYKDKEKKNETGVYKLDKQILKKPLFDHANITGTKKDKALMINSLWKDGYIKQNYVNDDISISIDLSEGNEEEVLKVYTLDNLGNQIIAYLKPNYKQCQNCGKLIKIKKGAGRPQKYCEQCYKKINEADAINRMKKYREK